ncbi:MAG: peptidase S8 [Candidatus Viridilinea halotolerans]|uniref:Peptidase S8 n=1 Tax=Candidatus Viridilinea halotolerans TaxID=2491704 RepID=A0A426TWJ5_9CHLR|nr:MAG: peptidase S8 [Candidatus Viridilinea halotolerans]
MRAIQGIPTTYQQILESMFCLPLNPLAGEGGRCSTAMPFPMDALRLPASSPLRLSASPPPHALASASLCAADDQYVCWHLRQIGADRVWQDFGVRGSGITVATIDSGVYLEHPALFSQYRGNQGEGQLDHRYNWYDPYGLASQPTDAGTHGTHVMGILVGRGSSASAPAIGVAPNANWIAARACSSRDCDEIKIIQAAQWLLAPTDANGRNPRPDLRPHIINNSWTSGQDSPWFTSYADAWRAAGIYPVFAAGNSGNSRQCGTVLSPGDYLSVTSVGATDSNAALSSFSSIGPTLDGRIKPDLVAPGSAILSSVADQRNYAPLNGTSMASPHVAAAVALLWAANPALIGDYATTYAALTSSATAITVDARFLSATFAACRPDQIPNSIIGYGQLDAYAAVRQVRVEVPWLRIGLPEASSLGPGASTIVTITLDARYVAGPGSYQARVLVYGNDLSATPLSIPVTMHVPGDAQHARVTGRITGASTGGPLHGLVSVSDGPSVATDANGNYALTLPAAASAFQLQASAPGYASQSASQTLAPGQQITLDFALTEAQPQVSFVTAPRSFALGASATITASFTISNPGATGLSYSASIANEAYGVWRSDEPDGPVNPWRAPPSDATMLDLSHDGASDAIALGFDFPFFSQNQSEVRITANGLLVFGPLANDDVPFSAGCMPLSETSYPAIAALRADLDPSQNNARVSYAQLPEGFLVTWENVPLAADPSVRLSFQALLQPDGRISLHYQQMSGLSSDAWASVGLQRSNFNHQNVSCRNDRPLFSGLNIELRPQPLPSNWISLFAATGNIVPGGSGQLTAQLYWYNPTPYPWPFSATLELRSNDPQQPLLHKPIRAQAAAVPYTILLPLVAR